MKWIAILFATLVIGVLVLLSLPTIDHSHHSPKTDAAWQFVHSPIRIALLVFHVHMGRYPTTEEGLKILVSRPDGERDKWKGPYLADAVVPLDPWGSAYQYRFPARKSSEPYDAWSLGPDKRESKDDIGNWNNDILNPQKE